MTTQYHSKIKETEQAIDNILSLTREGEYTDDVYDLHNILDNIYVEIRNIKDNIEFIKEEGR